MTLMQPSTKSKACDVLASYLCVCPDKQRQHKQHCSHTLCCVCALCVPGRLKSITTWVREGPNHGRNRNILLESIGVIKHAATQGGYIIYINVKMTADKKKPAAATTSIRGYILIKLAKCKNVPLSLLVSPLSTLSRHFSHAQTELFFPPEWINLKMLTWRFSVHRENRAMTSCTHVVSKYIRGWISFWNV